MKIFSNALIYLSSSILNKAIPFLMLPILTVYLSPENYGTLALCLLINNVFIAFMGMNMQVNISRFFAIESDSNLAKLIGNIILILLGTLLLIYSLIFGLLNLYEEVFSIPTYYIAYLPLLSFLMILNTLNLTILRNEGRAYLFGVIEVTSSILIMVGTIIFLVIIDMGWISQLIGMLLTYFVMSLFSIYYILTKGYCDFSFSINIIKKILNISVPMIPHVLGSLIIGLSDRIFIEKMVGLNDVGIYTVAYSFGMIIGVFCDSFIKSWSPWFYKVFPNSELDKKRMIVKYTYGYFFVIFSLAIALSYFSKFILPLVVSVEFSSASSFIIWIALGYACQGIYKIFFPYIVVFNKTKLLALITSFTAILNLIFNYIFILNYGTVGAAYSTLLSFIISSILTIFIVNKYTDLPWFNVCLKNRD
ncbi:oligosaccharide flippase family protein [Colwellia sp. MB3u-70]|uniref:lipopolysaccharide biosynthesis protein n=1 Tax=unclassified Colwellia TaxID=196834 RepID=UPI0015F39398|nr:MULTISPECIES: oligosaccharide flippase family protein [unclassified Colwellia]MBA6291506.1 oligosaccharide flippase family protein [Colwellia sp. MB3u-8]MBA6305648.1 oligosaccharide flippase family protein [Colwellia sp. MB3u-70]